MSNQFDYLLKYIIIGDEEVGKSNLLSHYMDERFTSEYESTIGVELKTS